MNKTVTIEIEVGEAMLKQLNDLLAVAKIMGTTLWAIEQLQHAVEHNLNCDGTCAFTRGCSIPKVAN